MPDEHYFLEFAYGMLVLKPCGNIASILVKLLMLNLNLFLNNEFISYWSSTIPGERRDEYFYDIYDGQ